MEKKKTWCLVVVILCIFVWSGNLFAVMTAPYYPIEPGNSWTYSYSYNNYTYNYYDTGTSTYTVLKGTVPVNGVPTVVIDWLDSSVIYTDPESSEGKTYITNDQNGIRIHRAYAANEWFEDLNEHRSVDTVFSPPMQMAYAEAEIGDSIFSTGTATVTIEGIGTFDLTYSLTSTIAAIENITVPAGSYQAVKIKRENSLTGNINGENISETSTETDWLVKGLGAAKYSDLASGEVWQEELIATNVVPKVNPTAGANGAISPNTPQYVPDNETITFTVTPDHFYQIDSVTGCGGTLTGNSYTTAPVTEDCEVVATFYRAQSASLPWLLLLLDDE